MTTWWIQYAMVPAVAVGAYLWLIVVLRLNGKRSLSKLNAFDFAIRLDKVGAVVLETDGSFSVIEKSANELDLLYDVRRIGAVSAHPRTVSESRADGGQPDEQQRPGRREPA
ncbi:MAG: hypothetical protein WKF52_04975 [Sphingomicrobium sp.]